MPIVLGQGNSDVPKLPMLKEFVKKNGTCPNISYVRTILSPNKFPQFTLILDAGFRVSVYEDNPLHGELTRGLSTFEDDKTCLYIQMRDKEKLEWNLCVDETKQTEWETKPYGLTVYDNIIAKKRVVKNQRVTKRAASDVS